MAFQLVSRIRTMMLVVPACPGSGFLDVPHGRGHQLTNNTVPQARDTCLIR